MGEFKRKPFTHSSLYDATNGISNGGIRSYSYKNRKDPDDELGFFYVHRFLHRNACAHIVSHDVDKKICLVMLLTLHIFVLHFSLMG